MNEQSSSGVLPRLCGGAEGCAAFFARDFGRAPVHFRGTAAFAVPTATAEICEALLQEPRVDFMLARAGRPHGGRPGLEESRRLFSQGYTWVLRDVDHGDAGLAELGRALASDLHGTLHLQVYRSPAGAKGFGWHFDPEEVFVFQTHGHKRFLVRENAQHPLPLAEQMPAIAGQLSADAERGPISEYLLSPGDCLYLPPGWWHVAQAEEESISISAGVLAPSFVDALAWVTAELARDPRWRRRLPPLGRATGLSDAERAESWSESLAELARELAERLAAPELPGRLYAATGWWRQRARLLP